MRLRSFKIPVAKREEVARAAIEVAEHVYCDKLDINVSIRRVPTTKTVDEVLQMCLDDSNSHWVFIERTPEWCGNDGHFDVGSSTMGLNVDYFLWIRVPIPAGNSLISRFKLEDNHLKA